MQYTIIYPKYTYTVKQCLQDILEFEYFNKFNEYYTNFWGLLTQEQRDFIKDMESKWLKNEIHEDDYYSTRNFAFLDFIADKYRDDAEYVNTVDEYDDPDDWWDSLDDDTKEDVMEMCRG